MEQTCHPLDRVSDRRHVEFAFFPAQLTADIDIPFLRLEMNCIAFWRRRTYMGQLGYHLSFHLFLEFIVSSGVTGSVQMGEL